MDIIMIQAKGKNSDNLKQDNMLLVLRLIALNSNISNEQNMISRIDIAKSTGLSKMTVSNIVLELIQLGYVREIEEDKSSVTAGRRKVLIAISEKSPIICGINISRDYCTLILMSLSMNILQELKFNMSDYPNNKSFMEELIFRYNQLTKDISRRVLAIGISCIGPIDYKNGVILNPPNFYDISNLDICDKLNKITSLPVYMDNDMNTSATAEKLFGNAVNVNDFLYIGLTNGVGSGVVINGEVFAGSSGFSGEIGHICVEHNGEVCNCSSYGCLETYASIPILTKRIKSAINNQSFDISVLQDFYDDTRVSKILNDVCDKIGFALTTACNILDPEVIFIGHDGVYLSQKNVQRIEKYISSHIFAKSQKHIKVCKTAFGNNSPVLGSAAMIMDKIFKGKIPLE